MSGSLVDQRPGAVYVCLKLALLPALLALSSVPCSGLAFAPPRGAVRLTRIDGPLLSGPPWPGRKPSPGKRSPLGRDVCFGDYVDN